MYTNILPQDCLCHDCGKPLDTQHQDDGKGGSYIIVTCWNPTCLLRAVTRSLMTYRMLTDSEWESYREMNRAGSNRLITAQPPLSFDAFSSERF